jgi:hypothetical protein
MDLDRTLLLGYLLSELAVIALLLYRRAWRIVPFFCVYCAWDILSNSAVFFVQQKLPNFYLPVYLGQTAVDASLQFCVLVELAWSVLRPLRTSLPKKTLFLIAAFILILGAAVWPLSDVNSVMSSQGHILMHLMQTVSVLRIVFFLALAGCSQLLSLSWKDRELQVATGLGIYSIVSLGVAMYHTHATTAQQNSQLYQFVIGSYICSLVYWIICFSQREAERQEFTPQMQNLLLAMAGVARADREALARRTVTSAQGRRDS